MLLENLFALVLGVSGASEDASDATRWYVPSQIQAQWGVTQAKNHTDDPKYPEQSHIRSVPFYGVIEWPLKGLGADWGLLAGYGPYNPPKNCLDYDHCQGTILKIAPTLDFNVFRPPFRLRWGAHLGYEKVAETYNGSLKKWSFLPDSGLRQIYNGLGSGLTVEVDGFWKRVYAGPWVSLEGSLYNSKGTRRTRSSRPGYNWTPINKQVVAIGYGIGVGYRFGSLSANPSFTASHAVTESVPAPQKRPHFELAMGTGAATTGDDYEIEYLHLSPMIVGETLGVGGFFSWGRNLTKCETPQLYGDWGHGDETKVDECTEYVYRLGGQLSAENTILQSQWRYRIGGFLGAYVRKGYGEGTLYHFEDMEDNVFTSEPISFIRTQTGSLTGIFVSFDAPVSRVWRMGFETRGWFEFRDSVGFNRSVSSDRDTREKSTYFMALNFTAIYLPPPSKPSVNKMPKTKGR